MTRAVGATLATPAKDIVSSDDQGWPRILQHLAQPVAGIVRIQRDKGASRRQAGQHGERTHRTRRQYYADQVSRFGFSRDGFGESGEAIPQFRIRERGICIRDRDTVWMPARHALEVFDDRPIQIFVAKPGENPTGWAVPVQRMLTVFQPLQTRTERGIAARVVHDCNWTRLSHPRRLRRRESTACSILIPNRTNSLDCEPKAFA